MIYVNKRVKGHRVRKIEMPPIFRDPPPQVTVHQPLDQAYIRHLDYDKILENLAKFISRCQEAPPPNRVEPAEGGGVRIFSGYHADFLEALKLLVPWGSRKWDPDSKTWWIAEEYAEQATGLFQIFWEDESEGPEHGL